MSDPEAPNHKLWRAQISEDNLEYLNGNGPYEIFITCVKGGYQVIVLDPDHKVVVFGDAEQKIHESETEVLRTLLKRTSLMVREKYGKNQDGDGRPEGSPPNEGDRPHEESWPEVTPGGLFDTKPPGHFSFENNSNCQRPPHVPLHGNGPLHSGGMFGTTPRGGLFGNSTNTQGQPTCGTAGQGLFAFGSNNNVQGQPTQCLFGNNIHRQGQPTGACQITPTIPPSYHCTNRAAGGLFGHCPSGQGLFRCNGSANGHSGAYNSHPHVSCLPVSYSLFAHPSGCNTTVTVNLNGLTISGTNSDGRDRYDCDCDCDCSNSVQHNSCQFEEQCTCCTCTNGPQRCSCDDFKQGSNNQNNNIVNNQFKTAHRFKPGHRGLWSSPFSPADTHAHVAKGSLFGPSAPHGGLFSAQPGGTNVAAGTLFRPSARDKPQRLFEDSPVFPATPGPVTGPRDLKVPRGLFGAQPDTLTGVPAKDKSSGGLFGQYTVVPNAHAEYSACDDYKPFFSGPGPFIESTADPRTPEPETFGPRIASRGGLLFGSAYSKTKDTRLAGPSAVCEFESRPENFDKRARFSATVEDASSLSGTEISSNSRNNKWKGKAVSKTPHSTEPSNTKKRVSLESVTPASAPGAKKDAVSSRGGVMGSQWVEAAKHADHTSTVNEADHNSSGGVPELSSIGAAMRAAAEQTTSVPDHPGSMFAPKVASAGHGIPETATTQQSHAPTSLFGSSPGSMFGPAPAPAPASAPAPAPGTTAPGPAPAPSLFAPSPFASSPVAPSMFAPSAPSFAPSAPSFAGPSVLPTVVPSEEPVTESAEKSLEEPVKEAAKESVEVEKPAAEKTKKANFGGLFDSKYAS